MSTDDFDSAGLARYLHLSPDTIDKMASRGKLPARRVGGEWRFSQADIHHWLEERIGVLEEPELEQLESRLDQSDFGREFIYKLDALMPPEAVAAPLAARTRNSVMTEMVELAAATGRVWDVPKLTTAVRSREDLFPTALPGGMALLHPRRPMPGILGEPVVAFGRTNQGLPFARGELTDLFFLIGSVDDRGHLHTLARLTRIMTDETCRNDLRAAPSAEACREILLARELALDA